MSAGAKEQEKTREELLQSELAKTSINQALQNVYNIEIGNSTYYVIKESPSLLSVYCSTCKEKFIPNTMLLRYADWGFPVHITFNHEPLGVIAIFNNEDSNPRFLKLSSHQGSCTIDLLTDIPDLSYPCYDLHLFYLFFNSHKEDFIHAAKTHRDTLTDTVKITGAHAADMPADMPTE